jgi:hypothetical protein
MRNMSLVLIFLGGLWSLGARASAEAAPAAQVASAPQSPSNIATAKRNCRAISAELRSDGPFTREAVIQELVRARSEGELDFHLSTTPPAQLRPLCPLP